MLNPIIKYALRFRIVTIALAIVLLLYGSFELARRPIDVFPDLNRPRVTVMTEAPGLAPEEVESTITFPLERTFNGATGVQAVRSASGVGLSVVNIEFDWGTDIYIDRQIIAERLALAADSLPEGVKPQLAPISSIMGQILQIGITSATGETNPIDLRTIADWEIRQQLLTIHGVAQVITIGGGRKQFQVLVDPELLLKYGVTLEEVEHALSASNSNATGGYIDQGSKELIVRSLGRIQSLYEIEQIVVKTHGKRSVVVSEVAKVVEAAQPKRGDAAIDGKPGIIMIISKQPGADTRKLTDNVIRTLDSLKSSLPKDVRINPEIYQQKEFIDLSIHNVIEALRDGGVLVVVILFLFLLNFRTTFITLTAIPLSIVITGLVFKWFDMSINTMTLGGLAVAIGELVDDAIVDVENIFRRLRENSNAQNPKSAIRVVYEASSEVRNSIVFSTILVVLVFIPLFALSGMEGRLFTPLCIAYIVSILASLVVSLTVTPVLSFWLLPNAKFMSHDTDGWLLRKLKVVCGAAIQFSLHAPRLILTVVGITVLVCGFIATQLGRGFLPDFNEGTVQVNTFLPPGTSLSTSNQIAMTVDERISKVKGVRFIGRRTGRAELDEHAEGVNVSEIIVTFDPEVQRNRQEILDEIRAELKQVPGVESSVEQPISHLISHMLSGVKAKIGLKLYGEDLEILRRTAEEMKSAVSDVQGVTDLIVEQQVEIPQLLIKLNPDRLKQYGLTKQQVNEFITTALNGRTVTELTQGQRKFDLVVRLDDSYRQDKNKLSRLAIELPSGGFTPLSSVAEITDGTGPNTINRENVHRRIVLQCNTEDRDLNSIVNDIQAKLEPIKAKLPTGYFIELGGQYESQRQATRMILLLSLISIALMFLALYTLFHSANLALQVLAALPMAAIGAVAALVITGQTLTIASMVGFISLAGIASRNGILLLAHYVHLVKHEGEQFTHAMIIRAGKERLAPMLMTALTAGIALVPLVLAANEPGKEILYPVATVILGGLISSTLLDFFVHPALFWCFGRAAAEHNVHESNADELE